MSNQKAMCSECGHAEESHFGCEVGSFCKECPTENHVWEHVFRPRPAQPESAAVPRIPINQRERSERVSETIRELMEESERKAQPPTAPDVMAAVERLRAYNAWEPFTKQACPYPVGERMNMIAADIETICRAAQRNEERDLDLVSFARNWANQDSKMTDVDVLAAFAAQDQQ